MKGCGTWGQSRNGLKLRPDGKPRWNSQNLRSGKHCVSWAWKSKSAQMKFFASKIENKADLGSFSLVWAHTGSNEGKIKFVQNGWICSKLRNEVIRAHFKHFWVWFWYKNDEKFQKKFSKNFFKNQNKADFSPFKAIFGRFRYGFGIKMMKNFQKFFEIFFFSKSKQTSFWAILAHFWPF